MKSTLESSEEKSTAEGCSAATEAMEATTRSAAFECVCIHTYIHTHVHETNLCNASFRTKRSMVVGKGKGRTLTKQASKEPQNASMSPLGSCAAQHRASQGQSFIHNRQIHPHT